MVWVGGGGGQRGGAGAGRGGVGARPHLAALGGHAGQVGVAEGRLLLHLALGLDVLADDGHPLLGGRWVGGVPRRPTPPHIPRQHPPPPAPLTGGTAAAQGSLSGGRASSAVVAGAGEPAPSRWGGGGGRVGSGEGPGQATPPPSSTPAGKSAPPPPPQVPSTCASSGGGSASCMSIGSSGSGWGRRSGQREAGLGRVGVTGGMALPTGGGVSCTGGLVTWGRGQSCVEVGFPPGGRGLS